MTIFLLVSQMFTLGFPFRPWKTGPSIADGPSILQYIRNTAQEFGIDKKIHYNSKLTKLEWDSETCRWTLTIEDGSGSGQTRKVITKFVSFTTGYYDYDKALPATIPGIDNFKGQVVHPQFWPKDFDYTGKKVVVIGSGATAVTLLPSGFFSSCLSDRRTANVSNLSRNSLGCRS